MDRREALKRTALMVGGIVSAPTIIGILNGCTAKPTIDWKPAFFSNEQGILVETLADIIIPKTDTPGAKDVGVPGFIDSMLKDVFTKEDQETFMNGLKAFDVAAENEYGDPFIKLSPKQQSEYVTKTHSAAIKEEGRPFILWMKELTVAGFFTSQAGATQVLQYEAVPGAYHGCLPIKEAGNGKTWATS